jgi:hypothetical protein
MGQVPLPFFIFSVPFDNPAAFPWLLVRRCHDGKDGISINLQNGNFGTENFGLDMSRLHIETPALLKQWELVLFIMSFTKWPCKKWWVLCG